MTDSNDLTSKLGRAILESRLESEISNLFSNISVKARSIKETLKKQKSDILIYTTDNKNEDNDNNLDEILNTSKLSDIINLDQTQLSMKDNTLDISLLEKKDQDALNSSVVD